MTDPLIGLPESPMPAHLRTMAPNSVTLTPEQSLDFIQAFIAKAQGSGILSAIRVDVAKDARGLTIRAELP